MLSMRVSPGSEMKHARIPRLTSTVDRKRRRYYRSPDPRVRDYDHMERRPYPCLSPSDTLFSTRQAFWPPKPKLFERTVFTAATRLTFGT